MTDSAPIVRPEKPCSKATNRVRPRTPCVNQKRRANFRHASMASVPLLQKNARCSPEKAAQAIGHLALERVVVEVRRVQQRRRLLGRRRATGPGWPCPSTDTPMPDTKSR